MRNLKHLRLEKGLNQFEMASELDMPQSTYQQYEAGITEPRFSTVIQIADYFNVSIENHGTGRGTEFLPRLPVYETRKRGRHCLLCFGRFVQTSFEILPHLYNTPLK